MKPFRSRFFVLQQRDVITQDPFDTQDGPVVRIIRIDSRENDLLLDPLTNLLLHEKIREAIHNWRPPLRSFEIMQIDDDGQSYSVTALFYDEDHDNGLEVLFYLDETMVI